MALSSMGRAACGVALLASSLSAGATDPLAAQFANPPAECALQAWWHWAGDCVTEEGIDRDLAAMAELEVGVAHVFATAMPGGSPLPKTSPLLSP